jgi:hypothetical protein
MQNHDEQRGTLTGESKAAMSTLERDITYNRLLLEFNGISTLYRCFLFSLTFSALLGTMLML